MKPALFLCTLFWGCLALIAGPAFAQFDGSKIIEAYEKALQSVKEEERESLSLIFNVLKENPESEMSVIALRKKLEESSPLDASLTNQKLRKMVMGLAVSYMKGFEQGAGDTPVFGFETFSKGRALKPFRSALNPKKEKVTSPEKKKPLNVPTREEMSGKTLVKSYAADGDKVLQLIAERMKENKKEFLKILTQVDNVSGANYEFEQFMKTLEGIKEHEKAYLSRIRELKNVAVYASTNIPFYTLLLHGIIPSLASDHVHFRTPTRTRDIYVQLFEKLKAILPEIDFSGLHLLTENSDVQYDNFLKKQVLGMDRQGNQFQRSPSEVVIFTGSPETAKKIQKQLYDKIEKSQAIMKRDGVEFNQIFLKFGSGLNPMVITDLAKNHLDVAVEATLDAISINTSQDCIAPKLHLIHKDVEEEFRNRLLKSLSQMKFGPLDDPDADYSALSFAKDEKEDNSFEKLLAFRKKHEKYLLNPEAVLDPVEKRVHPHYFSFPYSMFSQVELLDHFAPFIVAFEYNSPQELRQAANDKRLRDRAMFALMIGDTSHKDMFRYKKWFEDNFNTVETNHSLFKEESGNFPFGGHGENASAVTYAKASPDQGLAKAEFRRPLLFSKEASRYFPHPEAAKTIPTRTVDSSSESEREETLKNLLQMASDLNYQKTLLTNNWFQMEKPFFGKRPRGLEFLQNTIAKDGLTLVIECHQQGFKDKGATVESLAEFYGAPVLCWDDLSPEQRINLKGVVLHPAEPGHDIPALNGVRGVINPHLGWGLLTPILAEDRLFEYKMASSIWPSIIPYGVSFNDLVKEGYLSLELLGDLRTRAFEVLELIKAGGPQSSGDLQELKEKLMDVVTRTLQSAQKKFPKGSYVKNYGESATGDLQIHITSHFFQAKNIVDQYLMALNRTMKEQGDKVHSLQDLKDPAFQASITQEDHETGTKFVNKLLTRPETFLFQERVMVAKTNLGINREIRVDYMDGEAVNARGRYTHEYMREDEEEAKAVLKKFFDMAPEPFKYLSGGADLAKLEDGSWIIIEFNTGGNSGSTLPRYYPLEAHKFYSTLQQKPTPLLMKLEKAFQGDLSGQIQLLKSYHVKEEQYYTHDLRDIPMTVVAKWFRDRYLDEWRKKPTQLEYEKTIANLKSLFHEVGGEDIRELYLLLEGAELYMKNKLLGTK